MRSQEWPSTKSKQMKQNKNMDFRDALKFGHVLLSIFFYIGLKANCARHREN